MFPSTFGKLLEIVTSVIENDNKIMTLAQHLKPHHTLSTGLYNSLCYTNLCGRIIIYTYIYIYTQTTPSQEKRAFLTYKA